MIRGFLWSVWLLTCRRVTKSYLVSQPASMSRELAGYGGLAIKLYHAQVTAIDNYRRSGDSPKKDHEEFCELVVESKDRFSNAEIHGCVQD